MFGFDEMLRNSTFGEEEHNVIDIKRAKKRLAAHLIVNIS